MSATAKKRKPSPMDILNRVRDKAKLNDPQYQQIQVVRMKAGKMKIQLLALDPEFLFLQRRQHVIPTIPHDDDTNNKWLIVNCQGEDNDCPICKAAESFKKCGIDVEEVNAAYKPKYPYKNLRSVLTQADHYLLCAVIMVDQCEDGTYLPKNAEIGSTQFIQFSKTALNSLMSAYEDFIEDLDLDDPDDAPSLFAIFDGEDEAESLSITCRITNQPFSCTFSFGKPITAKLGDVDSDKLEILQKGLEAPSDEYIEKCIKRIRDIQNYFVTGGDSKISEGSIDMDDDDDDDDLPFSMTGSGKKKKDEKKKKPAPIVDEDDEEEDEPKKSRDDEEEEEEEEELPKKKSSASTKKKAAEAADKKKSSPPKQDKNADDDFDDFDLEEEI